MRPHCFPRRSNMVQHSICAKETTTWEYLEGDKHPQEIINGAWYKIYYYVRGHEKSNQGLNYMTSGIPSNPPFLWLRCAHMSKTALLVGIATSGLLQAQKWPRKRASKEWACILIRPSVPVKIKKEQTQHEPTICGWGKTEPTRSLGMYTGESSKEK